MKRVTLVAAAVVLLASTGFAERPRRNVSAARHPNLASAQRLCQHPYDKIEAAQRANEWDLDGHAKKAKELLEQVNSELKEAALAANRNR